MSEDVTVYLVDRVGEAANAFGAKLEGRQGVQLVGGTDNIDEALADIGAAALDVILVGTDVGGSGLVDAVEQVLAVGRDAAVVLLTSTGDKTLVAQGIRAGAVGSLTRSASPGETITALHLYKRRQQGEAVDMTLAEPPAQKMGMRVSGALPRFPSAGEESGQGSLIGAEETAPPGVAAEHQSAESVAQLATPAAAEEPPGRDEESVQAAVGAPDVWGAEAEAAWALEEPETASQPQAKHGLRKFLFRGGRDSR